MKGKAMNLDNFLNKAIYTMLVLFVVGVIGCLVWSEQLMSLILIVPLILCFSGWAFAERWAQKQPNRLVAFYKAYQVLLWYYSLILITQIVIVLVYPALKAERGTVATILGLIYAEQRRHKLLRWVKRSDSATGSRV